MRGRVGVNFDGNTIKNNLRFERGEICRAAGKQG